MKLYAKSLLYVLLAVAGVLVTAMADDIVTTEELINLGVIGLGAVLVYAVPNFPSNVGAYAKTIIAFATAALVSLLSFLTDGVTGAEWLQIAIAAFAGIGVFIVPNEKSAASVTYRAR